VWDWQCCGAPLAPWWWGRVGHPWHPGGGVVWGTPESVVVTLGSLVGHTLVVDTAKGGIPGSLPGGGHSRYPGWPPCSCDTPLISRTHTPPYRLTYRVFFSQRVYKDLTLTHAPLLPAIRDAHVGSHDFWSVEDNDIVIL